jgi:two-component sensor histidine kinase
MIREAEKLQDDSFPARIEQELGRQAMNAGAMITLDWNADTDAVSIDVAGQALFGLGNKPACTMAEIMSRIHHEDAGRFESNLHSILAGDAARIDAVRLAAPTGEPVNIHGHGSVLIDPDGHRHIVAILFDRAAPDHMDAGKLNPAEEKSHQIKNILGVISGIATMTHRTLESPAEFFSLFNSRLQALAKSADLAATSTNGFLPLTLFTASVAGAFAGGRKIDVGDCAFGFDANICQTLAIALHELTVNAVSHGAFSSPSGTTSVRFEELDDGSVRLVWQEKMDDFTAPEDPRQGFGWRMLTRAVAREFDTEPEIDWTSGGFRYAFTIAPDRLVRLTDTAEEQGT